MCLILIFKVSVFPEERFFKTVLTLNRIKTYAPTFFYFTTRGVVNTTCPLVRVEKMYFSTRVELRGCCIGYVLNSVGEDVTFVHSSVRYNGHPGCKGKSSL